MSRLSDNFNFKMKNIPTKILCALKLWSILFEFKIKNYIKYNKYAFTVKLRQEINTSPKTDYNIDHK